MYTLYHGHTMKTQTHTLMKILNKPTLVIPITAVIALIVGIVMYNRVGNPPAYTYATVEVGAVSGDVSVSGTIAANDSINLAFPKSGRVSSVAVTTGQEVGQGQVLAQLDSQDVQGSVDQAKGAYEAAEANYQKVVNGATSANVSVAQAAVTTAQNTLAGVQSQTATAVTNAYLTLLNSSLVATPTDGNASTVSAPVITGTYTGTTTGQYVITPYVGGAGQYFSVSGMESGEGQIGLAAPQALGSHGLYVSFPSNFQVNTSKSYIVTIPNTQASNYVTNYNAYQSALTAQTQSVNNAEAALAQAQASLTMVQTPARPEDVQAAQAQVDSTHGAYEAAQGALDNDLITAPIAGTVTAVNIKAGQNVNANQTAIGLISRGMYQIDVYVSSDDATNLTLGATSTVTFDAYPGVTFNAGIVNVDSGSSVVGSGADYKVTFQLTDNDPRIQTGLSAHIVVPGTHKTGVLEIPRTALITENGVHTVMVRRGGSVVSQVIQTGVIGSDMVEVVSGLREGDQVALIGNI